MCSLYLKKGKPFVAIDDHFKALVVDESEEPSVAQIIYGYWQFLQGHIHHTCTSGWKQGQISVFDCVQGFKFTLLSNESKCEIHPQITDTTEPNLRQIPIHPGRRTGTLFLHSDTFTSFTSHHSCLVFGGPYLQQSNWSSCLDPLWTPGTPMSPAGPRRCSWPVCHPGTLQPKEGAHTPTRRSASFPNTPCKPRSQACVFFYSPICLSKFRLRLRILFLKLKLFPKSLSSTSKKKHSSTLTHMRAKS